MGDLWDGIKEFFANKASELHERQVANKITMLEKCGSVSCITLTWENGPAAVKDDERVIAYKNQRISELTAQGILTPTDQALGMFKALPAALYGGFGELSDTMQTAITESLKKGLTFSSTDQQKAFSGVLDTVFDGMLNTLDKDKTKIPESVRTDLKTKMAPIMTLGLTFTVATALAELIHPTKEMGWGHVSHFLYDTVGMRALMAAYIDPIRDALIATPTRYAVMSLAKPFYPTEGEMTGLARKYEVTEAQYREGMAAAGVKDEWVDALLHGFWADPRLFEILRLMEVTRPDQKVDPEAEKWLKKAGLQAYVGPDWWLAMKFGKAGYDKIDIPVLIKVVRSRFLSKELGDIRTLDRNLYKDGVYDRATYEKKLAERNITKEEAKELLDSIDRERAAELNKILIKAWEKRYAYKRTDEKTLLAELKKLGMTEERAKARIEYLNVLVLGKLASEYEDKVLTDTKILDAYETGLKTKEWAVKALDDKGFTTSDALLLADISEKGIKKDISDEWARAYEQRVKNGRMSVEELEKKYMELGRAPEWAKARAAYVAELAQGKVA